MMIRKVFALLLALMMICTAAVFCPGFAEDDTSWATQTDLDEEEEDEIDDSPLDIAAQIPAEDGEQYWIAEGTGLADGSLRFACGAEMLKNLADRTFVMLLLKKTE